MALKHAIVGACVGAASVALVLACKARSSQPASSAAAFNPLEETALAQGASFDTHKWMCDRVNTDNLHDPAPENGNPAASGTVSFHLTKMRCVPGTLAMTGTKFEPAQHPNLDPYEKTTGVLLCCMVPKDQVPRGTW